MDIFRTTGAGNKPASPQKPLSSRDGAAPGGERYMRMARGICSLSGLPNDGRRGKSMHGHLMPKTLKLRLVQDGARQSILHRIRRQQRWLEGVTVEGKRKCQRRRIVVDGKLRHQPKRVLETIRSSNRGRQKLQESLLAAGGCASQPASDDAAGKIGGVCNRFSAGLPEVQQNTSTKIVYAYQPTGTLETTQ